MTAIEGLYYITHIENLSSILEHGILSHECVEEQGIKYTPIYDKGIVTDRKEIFSPNERSLWGFANLYFNPRNPMLYRVVREKSIEEIVVVAVRPDILNLQDICITTGNARAWKTEILSRSDGLSRINEIKQSVEKEWWTTDDGSKREIMAECLIQDYVPPNHIQAIYVANHKIAKQTKEKIPLPNIDVIPEPHMFFQPKWKSRLTSNLVLVDGDMLFSKMQTLTVSVNCVGVMGKGLASRVKYQFPGVYVAYQDLCKSKKLKMGKPYLLKREFSLDQELADEPQNMSVVKETQFLLFATKRHWRNRADIKGIEQGLEQVLKNYNRVGIKSLAVPALGCGLGWLQWREVGPLICKYLSQMDIPVAVYLPREKNLPSNLLSKEFLLA